MSFLLLTAAALISGVVGEELMIKSVDDFIDFSKVVNKGTNYSGTTVFLDSDLSFAGKSFEPIGTSTSKYFNGTFDGQGHLISNLKITSSSSEYVGLFGYSQGLTVKNVILDSSCSITSFFIGSDDTAYTGGIIGRCYPNYGPCTIENSVNMGSVTFSGNISDSLYLGGIAGLFSLNGYDSIVKNCANYGSVTHSGTSDNSYVGGLVGDSYGSSSSSNRVYIYNSLNLGTITHSGTTTDSLYLGEISGRTRYTTIENCVSGGKISSNRTSYIGRIVGYVSSDSSVNYCYYTSELSDYGKYGSGNPDSESNTFSYDSTSFELNGTVSVGNYTGSSFIGALNAAADYYILRDYSHWLLNKDSKAVSFTINKKSFFTMYSQITLLPNLASEGNMWFDGWYKDKELTSPLTEYEITNDIELYGKFEENANNYTIMFEAKGGSSIPSIMAPFGSVVTLPRNSIREHCTFSWWENEYGDKMEFNFTMSGHNITLYAVWKCTHIETSDDFIDFFKVVNDGNNYYQITVYLDSDFSLAGRTFEPIGKDWDNCFLGIFDGQGHVISNLVMNSSSQYIGLFGYSRGLTIRNVILDSSCSITSPSRSGNVYVGGIIGWCWAYNGPCIIENSVNMGSVTFDGSISGSLNLGGIAGYLSSFSEHEITVKNCANYGSVTHSGTSDNSYVGGIAGDFGGSSSSSSSKRVYIYNSLNHGTATHNGTTSNNLYFGGIVGFTREYTIIENCVSAGKISSNKTTYIGGIVGSVSESTIQYCYFTSDLNGFNVSGRENQTNKSNTLSYDSTTFELNGTVSVGSYSGKSLIDALNAFSDYYTIGDYSHWLLNKDNKDASFTINGRTNSIKMNYQVILMPSLASEGIMIFDGWYEDKELTNPFTETETSESIELYGTYCGSNYTVTFDVNGGDGLAVKEMIICCERVYGDLPEATKIGHTFIGWFTEKIGGTNATAEYIVKITANQTLYAHWTANKYTVTFNVNGGNALSESESKKEVTYESTYGDLPEATRTDFSFAGWFTEKNESITKESIVSISDNHTLRAHWLEVSKHVEIVFGTKDMTQEEIEEAIKKYTDADFVITAIESDNGETRVIIKFTDSSKAVEFVETVKGSSEAKATIKKAEFKFGPTTSFSPAYYPMLLLFYLKN